jgi:hypothetical protein
MKPELIGALGLKYHIRERFSQLKEKATGEEEPNTDPSEDEGVK